MSLDELIEKIMTSDFPYENPLEAIYNNWHLFDVPTLQKLVRVLSKSYGDSLSASYEDAEKYINTVLMNLMRKDT